MVSPFIVTVPYGDAGQPGKSDERQAYENKVMDILLDTEAVGPSQVYEDWHFYPYRNPNARGQALTPQQMHDLLADELDFFPPLVRSLHDLAAVSDKRLKFRQPSVPPYRHHRTGEVMTAEGSDEVWADETPTGVYILDGIDCRHVRFFHVDWLVCEMRFKHKFRRDKEDAVGVGQDKSGSDSAEDDNEDFRDEYTEKYEDEAIQAVRQGNEPPMDLIPLGRRYVNSSNWLGIPLKDAFMYGIEAAFIPIEEFWGYTMRAHNLGHTLDEFLDDWHETEEEIQQKLQEGWEQLHQKGPE